MNRLEPLGLPRGSVRAILTLLLVVVSAVGLFVPVVDDTLKQMFVLLTGIAVRDYFASRKDQNDKTGPPLDPPATFED